MSIRAIHGEASLQLLAEVSDHVARTVHAETLVEEFAEAVTQGFCDWCVVQVPSGCGTAQSITCAVGPDGPDSDAIRTCLGEAGGGAIRQFQAPNQTALLLRNLNDDVAAHCLGPALRDWYVQAGVVSALVCSTAACDELPLVVHFLSRHPDHPFSLEDRDLAEEIGMRLVAAVLHARDYERAEQTAAELRAANASKDAFLGMVSHELRTPITVIHGAARLLRMRRAELTAEQEEQLALDIETESERLHHMIENLLVLAQASGTEGLGPEPVLVQHTVTRVVERFERRHLDRKVTVHVAGRIPPAAATEPYVEQMLRNLLNNAAKYSPEGSGIDVEVVAGGASVEIRVLDRGDGIDPADVPKLFEPFRRMHPRARSTPGAGLGLAVCKRLAEAMSGSCSASRRTGGGSVFTIQLREYA